MEEKFEVIHYIFHFSGTEQINATNNDFFAPQAN